MEITKQEALELLRARKGWNVTLKDLAAEFGVSVSFMSQVLSGHKDMTKAMLASVGVDRRVVFERKSSSKKLG